MAVSDATSIIEHARKAVTQTVYETRWVPCSARFVVLGSPPRGTGLIQIYNLSRGEFSLLHEAEKPSPLKCGTFGASSLAERRLATGDFTGKLNIWDLENLAAPVFAAQAHAGLLNCIDGVGGLKGSGAPEIVTGGKDGSVKVWDPRQADGPVASMEPKPGDVARDCWAVAFGDSHSASDRVVAAGYDNGDVKLLDLRAGKVSWETNVQNGVCGLQFDRQDIEMNKLVVTTLESRYRLYDMRTHHPTFGYSMLSQEAHESTVWGVSHLPQNRDVFMTCGGNGSLELWKYAYPAARRVKDRDGHEKGVLGSVSKLQKTTISTQPISSFDWSADKEGLCVMGVLDQTFRVALVTKLSKV
ncbi:WD40-repeat-containing domain protein [Pavlovales sp. CCMP2436]|nr:WD40-repeat-containing domain protein [Pavlovales sp. CCMP2436]